MGRGHLRLRAGTGLGRGNALRETRERAFELPDARVLLADNAAEVLDRGLRMGERDLDRREPFVDPADPSACPPSTPAAGKPK